ncbi:MAG: excinuclease ABC subunit UvrC [Planctomycetota bacterium]
MALLPFDAGSARQIPREPGCYLFIGEKSRVLYVGKAVDLRSRVASYFNRGQDDRLVTRYVHRFAKGIDYVVAGSEKEALLLENSLIKKHRPRFNVRLTDDKTYFSLELDLRAEWPRIRIVRRRRQKDGVVYFGPYPSASACRRTLQFLGSIFPLRSCSDSVLYNRTRPCISYEIKRCVAPCVGLVERPDYMKIADDAVRFLRGKNLDLLTELERKMKDASAALEFERAAELRDRIEAIRTTVDNPQVTRNARKAFDVVGLYRIEDEVQITVLFVREGVLASSANYRVANFHDTDELLRGFLGQFYADRPAPEEIILPEEAAEMKLLEETISETQGRGVRLVVPERGEKRRLLALAERNAEEAWRQRHEDRHDATSTLQTLRHDLELVRMPHRIECFDLSNLMGRHVVGSCAAFTDGRPDKARYRRYKIRTVEGQDDFAGMAEVIRRRLTRGLREDDLPDLIVIDGGKGQLGAAHAVLKELGVDRVDLVSLAKAREEREGSHALRTKERVFRPGSELPIVLEMDSPASKLLVRVRDEAHRFAITYHRRLREKADVTSVLELVPGIGPRKARALLKTFGSVRAVREADDAVLAAMPGMTDRLVADLRAFFANAGHLEDRTGRTEVDPDDT